MSAERPKSLYPNYLNPKTGKWGQAHTSMGALGDSYEYLLKEWLRSGKRDLQAKSMFDSAALDVERQLVKSSPGGLMYFAEYKYGRLEHKMDELACFGGGMYALAAHEEQDANSDRWMQIGEGITNTCHEAFDRSDTKLAPEAFRFSDSVEARALKSTERYYILRPETFESYFYLWRLTHDQKYRDWGWEAVQVRNTSRNQKCVTMYVHELCLGYRSALQSGGRLHRAQERVRRQRAKGRRAAELPPRRNI